MSIGKKIIVAFVVNLAILVAVGAIGLWAVFRLDDTNGWVTHTYKVRLELERLLSALKDAETSERDYVITRKESFSTSYVGARGIVQTKITTLRVLTKDNGSQQLRLTGL